MFVIWICICCDMDMAMDLFLYCIARVLLYLAVNSILPHNNENCHCLKTRILEYPQVKLNFLYYKKQEPAT